MTTIDPAPMKKGLEGADAAVSGSALLCRSKGWSLPLSARHRRARCRSVSRPARLGEASIRGGHPPENPSVAPDTAEQLDQLESVDRLLDVRPHGDGAVPLQQ